MPKTMLSVLLGLTGALPGSATRFNGDRAGFGNDQFEFLFLNFSVAQLVQVNQICKIALGFQ